VDLTARSAGTAALHPALEAISTIVESHCDEKIFAVGTFKVILPFKPMVALAESTGQPACIPEEASKEGEELCHGNGFAYS
jgi:hypothetical protein